ncbi:hypothetical protein [uncultured Cohaesibacter sp.]|uniref:hypothetical protein n=1 Tax=uncultured Cohaesibacter sp. TaxID=1002546 RepID=UPI00292EBF31|nr:hypothetical protein [uncultured Cohaesibacter sp.]
MLLFALRYRPSMLRPGFADQARNEAVRYCTTGFNKTHKTTQRRVLYEYHAWSGQEVLIEKIVNKAGIQIARCHQVGDTSNIALEIPLWMFDRQTCLSVQVCHYPRVDVSGLSALHFLLAQIAKASELDLSSSAHGLSADFMSGDQNQGGDNASISTKPRATVKSIQSIGGTVPPSDAALANAAAGDAHQNNQINGANDDGTRSQSRVKSKHWPGHSTLGEGER